MAEPQQGTCSGVALSRDRPGEEGVWMLGKGQERGLCGEQVWSPSQESPREHGERQEEADCSPPWVTRTHTLFPKQTYLLSALPTCLALCW